MDNNFNSNNQFEPEKPFTEKPTEPQPAPVFETENTENNAETTNEQSVTPQYRNFEPEKPFENGFSQPQQPQNDFAPQTPNFEQPQHNGYYQNNGCNGQYNPNFNQQYNPNPQYQQPFNPQPPQYHPYGNPQVGGRPVYQPSMDNTLIHSSNILNRTHHSINNINRSTDSRIINSQTLISSHTDSLMCRSKSRLLIIQIHTHNRQCRICHAKR